MGYLDDLFSLTGLRAVVTGGSSGIGLAAATALGRAGAAVHLVARDEQRLADAARSVAAYDVAVTTASVDVGGAGALAELAASDEVTGCDILLNCAGVNHRPPMGATTAAEADETIAVNLLAPYALGQAAGPRMAERGFGRILNVGSQQSWSAFGNSGIYGVSKAGVAGLSRSQAEAWSASGVTANTIVPGFVVTPMTAATVAEPGREEALAARHLVRRNGVPEDFAGAVVFLASPARRRSSPARWSPWTVASASPELRVCSRRRAPAVPNRSRCAVRHARARLLRAESFTVRGPVRPSRQRPRPTPPQLPGS